MKIAVLAGGLSTERNISFISGSNVCRALRERGHRAAVADLFLGFESVEVAPEMAFDAPDGLLSTIPTGREEPDLEAIRASRKDQSASIFGPGVLDFCKAADVVFLALHGQCGEDGRVQAAFDLMGIPYTGADYRSSAMAMDKAITKVMMESAGILTPRWQEFTYGQEDIPALCAQIQCPCVVKVVTGGSSLGVQVVDTAQMLGAALQQCLKYGNHIVVEEKIEGRELTCGVLGDRAFACGGNHPGRSGLRLSEQVQRRYPGDLPRAHHRRGAAAFGGDHAEALSQAGPVRLFPGRLSADRGRQGLLPGNQHPAWYDAHQFDSPGGGCCGHFLW